MHLLLGIEMISFLANAMSERKLRTFLRASGLVSLSPISTSFCRSPRFFVLVADNIDERGLSIRVSPVCASSQRRRPAHPRCAPCLQIASPRFSRARKNSKCIAKECTLWLYIQVVLNSSLTSLTSSCGPALFVLVTPGLVCLYPWQ